MQAPLQATNAGGPVAAPAQARVEARSTRQSPKGAFEDKSRDGRARRVLKIPQFPPQIEAQSVFQGPKHAWKPEARIETRSASQRLNAELGSARQRRVSELLSIVNFKTVTQSPNKIFIFRKIE